jgi:hypothetical protein
MRAVFHVLHGPRQQDVGTCTFQQHPVYFLDRVTLPITIRAQHCLTWLIKWVPVCPTWQARRIYLLEKVQNVSNSSLVQFAHKNEDEEWEAEHVKHFSVPGHDGQGRHNALSDLRYIYVFFGMAIYYLM